MNHFEHYARTRGTHRMTVIVGCVVAAHAVALWALQAGLLRKAAEVIVPVQVLSDFITPAPPPAPVTCSLPKSASPAVEIVFAGRGRPGSDGESRRTFDNAW